MYGVRPSLILTYISYFQDRNIVVKWHGVESEEKKTNKQMFKLHIKHTQSQKYNTKWENCRNAKDFNYQ